jgi:hypothetical protein
MTDEKTFERLLQLAYKWARAQEQFILANGASLGTAQIADAHRVGVRDCDRVRVLVIDRIPLPENKELADAARLHQIITGASRGVAIGHGIIIRADSWGDRELLVHQLAHVAQCERSGSLKQWTRAYLRDRHTCAKFTFGSFEEEARGMARDVCAVDAARK